MRISKSPRIIGMLTGALGGITGGIAEIGWIGLYGAATGIPLRPVARGIVESIVPTLATSAWAPEFGVLIHLGLAVALGIAVALVMPLVARRPEALRSELILLTLSILMAVWAINFLVVLPHINPAFVHLLPHSVTLFSKLLFGLAAATVFCAAPATGVAGVTRF